LHVKHFISLLAASAILAAAISSCGGDNRSMSALSDSAYEPEASTTVMTSASTTKAQFLKRVNEVCRETWATVLDNWRVYTSSQDSALSKRRRFEDAVRRSLLASIEFYIFNSIQLFGVPEGEERVVEEIIGPFQIAVELGWKKQWRAYSAADIASQFQIYNERARRYGLNDCLVSQSHIPQSKLRIK
jgi:hypothetical protein